MKVVPSKSKKYVIIICLLLIIGVIFRVNYDYRQLENILENELSRVSLQINMLIRQQMQQTKSKYNIIANSYKNRHTLLEDDYKSLKSFDKYLEYIKVVSDSRDISSFEMYEKTLVSRFIIPLDIEKNNHMPSMIFGINSQYIVDAVNKIVGTQAQVLVQSKNVAQDSSKYVILSTSPVFADINAKLKEHKKKQIVKVGEKTYAIFNHFVVNEQKQESVAKIIFAKDITGVVQTYKESLFTIYIINLLILLSVIAIFMRVKKNMTFLQNGLEHLNTTLESKVQQRTDEQNVLLSLFDNADSVLFKWKNDPYWSVEFASLGVSELLEHSLVDIMTNKISYASCIHQDDLERVMKEVKDASSSNVSHFKHKPYRVVTKNGDVKWILDYTAIVTDVNDTITHYIGHIIDITQLKSIEKQLIENSRMAQMGEMISMIAHQWRQPLGAISSTSIDLHMKLELEIFDMQTEQGREDFTEYTKKSLKQIDLLVQSLTTTIDDFRNFYKPDKERELSLVNAPMKKAYEILEASLKSKNVKVIQEYLSRQELLLYSNELMQVILNILQNAHDNFLEKKIQNAQISMRTYDIENTSIVEIDDNGGGISNEIIENIFDPYFSTKDEKNGTGLGLYMSKIIIQEHHNGKISVENIDGGVRFKIELFREGNNNED